MNLTCRFCNFQILETYYFCPNCGKKIKNPPLSTSLSKQLTVYAISILLPPLGVVPAIKYLLSKEKHAKIVGIIALILTVISIYLSTIFALKMYNDTMAQFNSLQYLGY